MNLLENIASEIRGCDSVRLRRVMEQYKARINSYEIEWDDSEEKYVHHIELNSSWICPDMECGIIREWYVTDAIRLLRSTIPREEWDARP